MNTQSILVRCAIAIAFVVPVVIPLAACSSSSPGVSGAEDTGTKPEGDSGTNSTIDTGTVTVADTGTTTTLDSTAPSTDTGTTGVSDAPATGTWAGMYACTLSQAVNVTAPLETPDAGGAPTMPALVVTESGTTITATLTGDSGTPCVLTFTDNQNDTASLSPTSTQSCALTAQTILGPQAVIITFTMGGTAKLSGNALNADGMYITVTDGAGDTLGIMGTGTASIDCTK